MNYTAKSLNKKILSFSRSGGEANDISDGYHTFGELYEHRIALFITLCNFIYKVYGKLPDSAQGDMIPWKSKQHHDGSMFSGGWFIAGIGYDKGKQISYHLPLKDWDKLRVVTYDKAPGWDGHTPNGALERLLELNGK